MQLPATRHRFFLLVTSLMALAAPTAPAAAQTKPADQAEQWTPQRMMRGKQIGSVQVSPDSRRVVYAVRAAVMEGEKSEYRTHIFLAGADGTGAFRLTQGDHSCDHPQWSPDGSRIAFLSSRSGKKNLWMIRPDGGEAQQLSAVKTDISSFKWSPDGRWIAFTAPDPPTPEEEKRRKEKNDARVVDHQIKMSRLHVIATDLSTGQPQKPRLLTPAPYSMGGEGSRAGHAAFDWSPDSKTIVFSHTRTPRPDDWPTADLALVETASGSVRPLVHTGAAEYMPYFSPDGRWIAYAASDDPPTWGGSGRLRVVSADGGTPRPLAETFDGFGRYSELLGWSADGERLYYTELHGTNLKLCAMPLEGKPVEISQAAGMSMSGMHLNASRQKIGFGWETLDRPPGAFLSRVDSFEPIVVSRIHEKDEQPPLGRTEVIRWKSTDGLEIEGLLTYPVGYEKGKRYPLLLVVHGGPAGAFTQTFIGAAGSYPVAAFASRGYAVLRTNVRGSSGYGRKFRYANYGDWGGKDYQDQMAGVNHVIGLGVADADRLGVMGWSYGGFMTSWIITQTKRFKAASVGAGVTNLVSFTGTSDIPSFLPDYFAGEFWDRLDAYRAHSAMFHVKKASTPTLIQHGERDERVPLSQGQELYNALKRQGCPVTMVIYPRTPHGIQEPKLLLDCMNRNLDWFDRYLRRRE